MPETSQDQWFYAPGGNEQRGPISFPELLGLAKGGQLHGDDLVWKPGMQAWTMAREIAELMPAAPSVPRPTVPPPMPRTAPATPKLSAAQSVPRRRFPMLRLAAAAAILVTLVLGIHLWRTFFAPPVDDLLAVVPRDAWTVALVRGLPQLALEFGALPGGETSGPFLALIAEVGTGLGLQIEDETSLLRTGLDITAPIGFALSGEEERTLIYLPVANIERVRATLASMAQTKGWAPEPAADGERVVRMKNGGFTYTFDRGFLVATTDESPEAAAYLERQANGKLGSVEQAPWFAALRSFLGGRWHVLVLADPTRAEAVDVPSFLSDYGTKLSGTATQVEVASEAIRLRYLEVARDGAEHPVYHYLGENRDRFADQIGGEVLGTLRVAIDPAKLSGVEEIEGFLTNTKRDVLAHLGSPVSLALFSDAAAVEAGAKLPFGAASWIPLRTGEQATEIIDDFSRSLKRDGLPIESSATGDVTWYQLGDGMNLSWGVTGGHLVVLWQASPRDILQSGTSMVEATARPALTEVLASSHDLTFYVNLTAGFKLARQILSEDEPSNTEDEPSNAKFEAILASLGDLVMWGDVDPNSLTAEWTLSPAHPNAFNELAAQLANQPSADASGDTKSPGNILTSSFHKARQKRTVSDIRNLGTAYMSWLTDQVGAASAGQGKRAFSISRYNSRRTEEQIRADLRPSDSFYYMKDIPMTDGWGHPLDVWISDNILAASVILIRSPGRDGVFTSDTAYDVGAFEPTDFDQDIVWADGYFIRWPDGTKR